MIRACLFSYFEVEDLPRLMEAIRASGMAAGARVHVGSYGVNAETSARVLAHPGGAIRHARQAGIRVSLWQLDELGTQIAGAHGRQHREFVRGILQGLNLGRRVLGDRASRGSVWATRRALRLASLPVDSELTAFWLQLERSAFRIVGEEYPDFVGDPARAARTWSDGHRALGSGGPARRAALAGRYLAGMSPGYRVGRGLGGNVAGL
jgi:hypothetical protein